MVAKISQGKSIRGILLYNENKVDKGEARLVLASNFAGEISGLNMMQKLRRFTLLTELNPRAKTNAMHISLNFSPQDKISDAKMQDIAADYMRHLGFADQPFLVYRHLDAAHPHLHIATVMVSKQGKRIDTHNIAKLKSEPARKLIEIEHQLTKAAGQPRIQFESKAAACGKVPTKKYMENTIGQLLDNWTFCTLSEYNALLHLNFIRADRGAEGTQMLERGGLVYHHLTSKGKVKGVPIKASSLYSSPTLKNLERHFEKSKNKRLILLSQTKKTIHHAIADERPLNFAQWQKALEKQSITAVLRKSEQGHLYGITYLDFNQKLVINGSFLGKAFSAKMVQQQFLLHEKDLNSPTVDRRESALPDLQDLLQPEGTYSRSTLETLLSPSYESPSGIPKKRKKKRRTNEGDIRLR